MNAPVVSPKVPPIDWQFQIVEQSFVTRYGKAGREFYRQYLPFGVTDPVAHPPKRIDPRLYEIAHRKAIQSEGKMHLPGG